MDGTRTITLLLALAGCQCRSTAMQGPAVEITCEPGDVKWSQGEQGIEHWCEVEDRMHGAYVRFHPDGSVAIKGQYVDNQPDGEWRWYFPTTDDEPKLERKGKYDQGKLTGEWSWWHDNGQMLQTGRYINGRQSGTWTTWYDNGQRGESGMYVNGLKDGSWGYWTPAGEEVRTEVWRRGELLE